MSTANQEPPIVIAGMGPAGLSAAIAAAKKNHPVIIVEPRDDFTRGQRVVINKDTFNFLKSLEDKKDPQDIKFFNEQISKTNVQVKDVQSYLTRKLEKYPNVTMHKGGGAKILDINPEAQTLILQKPDGKKQVTQFSHLVAADGAGSPHAGVVNLWNKRNKSSNRAIEYKKMKYQPSREGAGTVTLESHDKQKLPKVSLQKNFTKQDLTEFKKQFDWNSSEPPRVYVFPNKKNTKFYVAGETPPSIEKISTKMSEINQKIANLDGLDPNFKDQKQRLENARTELENEKRNQLTQWGQFILKVKMGYDLDLLKLSEKKGISDEKKQNITESDLSDETKKSLLERKNRTVTDKAKLNATAFSLTLSHAKKSVIELKKGSFCLLGDVAKNANFYLGHGLNDAIKDGLQFGACLDKHEKVFDFKSFKNYHKNQLNTMKLKMQLDKLLYPLASMAVNSINKAQKATTAINSDILMQRLSGFFQTGENTVKQGKVLTEGTKAFLQMKEKKSSLNFPSPPGVSAEAESKHHSKLK